MDEHLFDLSWSVLLAQVQCRASTYAAAGDTEAHRLWRDLATAIAALAEKCRRDRGEEGFDG